ncbi:MAG TPA: CYTH domain-containing protein, partial [Casimicrobiaceae bacterium]|nr:CYTH domain-containing protein [Casimicrobiaceae bacterium]
MHTEIELKLSVDPRAANASLRHPAVKALRAGRMRTARVDSGYYDTDDSLLAEADVALRVRRIGKRWVQTIKGPAKEAAGGGLFARAEYEWPLARPALDYDRLVATPWNKLIAKAIKRGGLARRFTTDFE